jgi:hypothetical protein
MIEILKKKNGTKFFFSKREMAQIVSWGEKNLIMFEKPHFCYEEETIFPWNAKFSHSSMTNEW